MSFFESISIRIPLAVIGGILYSFLISLGMDWSGSNPFGYTIQNLLNTLFAFL